MKTQKILTLQEARDKLNSQGLSVKKWSELNGVRPNLVRSILSGKVKGRIGKSHKVAVLLGIKACDFIGK